MSDNNIDMVLKAVNIVDVISAYIPLKKAGSNFKARCPFHDERTASFNVSETKQIFKCFGCQKAGNAIGFIMEYEKLPFHEALKKLADKAGISIKNDIQSKRKNKKRDLIYTIYELANDYFVSNFRVHGHRAKQYLEERQIPFEMAEKFSIGLALDSYIGLKSYLTRHHINSDILHETGLFRMPENKDICDLFRDRLMFPIHSTNGKVVAFGGRTLNPEQDKQYKYVNSPTTEIYTKGKELYGLHISRFDISKKGSVFVSEGYLDFLRLYTKGWTNSVASLGTALTKEQISLLSRYTKNFYLLYDGDDAGIKAAVKASALIIQHGCLPKIILLPNKHDPDSFLINHSNDDFQAVVDEALPLVRFVEKHLRLFGDKRQAIQMLLDISPEIEDHIARELFIKDISETYQVSEQNLRKNIQTTHINVSPLKKEKPLVSYKYEEEKKLLKFLLKNPSLIDRASNDLGAHYFINEDLKNIFIFLTENENKEYLNSPAMLIERLNEKLLEGDVRMSEELTKLFFDDDFLDNLDDLIRQVKLRKYENELKIINDLLSKDSQNAELIEKKYFVKRELVKLARKVVRNITFL